MVGDDLLCAEFISIHLPVGVGQIRKEIPLRRAIFQSTHPVRGGTQKLSKLRVFLCISIHPPRAGWDEPIARTAQSIKISIHPPRAGWDTPDRRRCRGDCNFNPPTPCGVGRIGPSIFAGVHVFQSTHPVRGGTRFLAVIFPASLISIHPPRAGWD